LLSNEIDRVRENFTHLRKIADTSDEIEPIRAIINELDKGDSYMEAELNTRNFIIEFLKSQNDNRTKAETTYNLRETTNSIGETGGRTNLVFGGCQLISRRSELRSKSALG